MCKFTISDLPQIIIAAVSVLAFIISLLTLIVIYCNLGQFWRQNSLTQLLNRPFCGVKQINVEVVTVPPSIDVIKIDALIVNSGNDYARDAIITSELYAIDQEKGIKTILVPKKANHGEKITILPKQEFRTFLLYIQKKQFNDLVGGFNRMAKLEMTIQYKDLDNKVMRYTCSYLITKLLTDNPNVNVYEEVLQASNLEMP